MLLTARSLHDSIQSTESTDKQFWLVPLSSIMIFANLILKS